MFFLEDPERSQAQLWEGDAGKHVAKMRELYAQFPENSDWISESEIEEYARRMAEVLAEKEAESVAEPSERSEAVTEEAPDDNVAVTPGQSEADAPGKQYELGYGYLGNGLTVWNRLEEERGDYKIVAHIDPERSVTFYDADMPEDVRAAIIREAATSELPDAPVFSIPPIAPEQVAVKTAYSDDKKTLDDNVAAISESVAESAEPQTLLLIQNGDFFELFGEDAEIAAPILGLALGHTTDGEGGSLTFCGFPVEQLQAALEKLTQKYSVKLSDKNGVREFPYAVPSVAERAQHERDSVTRTANDNASDSVPQAAAPITETENDAPKLQETAEQRKDAGKNRETAVFEYQGYRFEPAGVFPQNDDFSTISKKISSDREMGVSTYDWAKRPWSHDAFYQASGGVAADVFHCLETGKLYTPGENELFEYLGEYQPYPRQERAAKKDSQPERNASAPKESVAEQPVSEIAHTAGEIGRAHV